jgi:hypothetical protein
MKYSMNYERGSVKYLKHEINFLTAQYSNYDISHLDNNAQMFSTRELTDVLFYTQNRFH